MYGVLQVCSPNVEVQHASPFPPQCTHWELAPHMAFGPEHPPEPAVQQGLPSKPQLPPSHDPFWHIVDEPKVQRPPAATHCPFQGSQQPPLSHLAPGQHCWPGAPHAWHELSQSSFGPVHCVPQHVWLTAPHVPQLPFVHVPPMGQRAPDPVH
jgi:hypothetical protein